MPTYDTPGLTYDSGVFYDDGFVPPIERKRMAKVKLNLDRLSDEQLIQRAKDIKTALTGNANFTTPTPALAAVGTLITTAETKLGSSNAAQQAAKQATTEKNVAMDALRFALNDWGTYVQLTSGGVPEKIQSAGMDIKAPSVPKTIPSMVQNLFITAGDAAGELDVQWDPELSANNFDLELSPDPVTATSWVRHQPTPTKSQATATGLTSGSRMWARVRAVNSAGHGAWSDPATKIVP
jgi:hypothetical protein